MKIKKMSDVRVKDASKGEVSAVFATLGVKDSDGDVVMPGAITDGAHVVISAYGHQSWVGALPVGRGVIKEVDGAAVLDGRFLMDTTHGRDTFLTVEALSNDEGGVPGGLQEWSFSLEDVKEEMGNYGEDDVANYISAVTIKEVSPTLRGAGVGTRTLATKSMKFTDEATAVLAAVDQLHRRASEVVTLRAAKGKTIGDDAADVLRRVAGKASELVTLLDRPADESAGNDTTPPLAEAEAEFARFVQLTQEIAS